MAAGAASLPRWNIAGKAGRIYLSGIGQKLSAIVSDDLYYCPFCNT
ncbi:protein of unknown function [Xenorhabdus doucetiae]|uniref:Uncharacterized protein n=1 Tax=Xenorhabdus doucetiae TaxID=351671 RepID=A0A068QN20_9GAMM|nr:protein of unknown function [Xenorhabdus doucetiae]